MSDNIKTVSSDNLARFKQKCDETYAKIGQATKKYLHNLQVTFSSGSISIANTTGTMYLSVVTSSTTFIETFSALYNAISAYMRQNQNLPATGTLRTSSTTNAYVITGICFSSEDLQLTCINLNGNTTTTAFIGNGITIMDSYVEL